MGNKQQQKEKIKAKQRSMQEVKDSGLSLEERQTKNLNEVIRQKKEDETSTEKTEEAVNAAIARSKEGVEEIDPRMMQLFRDFKLYRVLVIALVVIGFGLALISNWLVLNETITEDDQIYMALMGGIVIVGAVAIGYGRARPIREDINAWNKVNQMALRQSHGAHGATTADVDKILYSRARNKRIPPTPQYKRMRRVWLALTWIGVAFTAFASLIATRSMADVTVPIVMIFISMALLILAFIWDRWKMKPLRDEWTKDLDKKIKEADKAARKSRRK